jgi:thioredoxin 2
MPLVFHADSTCFDQLVYEPTEELVIVDFWGHPCPNCADFMRDEARLLARIADLPVRVVKVNAYEELELTTRFGLRGVPTFLLIKNGETLGRMSFYPGYERWLEVVTRYIPDS